MVLRDRAPEGLVPWLREQKDIDWPEYLIYKAGNTREPITGLSQPTAEAVCSACGARMTLERAYNVRCSSGSASFGVAWMAAEGGFAAYGSGQEAACPECGKKVTVLHTSAAKNLRRYVWPMSLERVGNDLVCYMWRAERGVHPDGSSWISAVPWEAVVFGEKSAGCYKHWCSGVFGHCFPDDRWTGLSQMKDRFFDIELLWCPEGIEQVTKGTWLENSKLELYMNIKGEYLFPIVWLRLYQRRHKAETLMTCGAAKLVAGIIAEEKVGGGYSASWTTRLDCLRDLDWKKTKPAEILRLTKQELPYFKNLEKKEGVHRLRVIQEARKKGYTIRPGDEAGKELSRDQQLDLLENGIMPSFVTRYLSRQKRRYKRDLSFYDLTDTWRMARELGIALDSREGRFPQNLRGKHDEYVARINEIKTEKQRREAEARAGKFTERFERMSRYAWEHDGILIRPAASEQELRKEGSALHHCVATYAKRHAAGELTIFFIRRVEEPDKPWFTLNFNEKFLSVTENRGLHNCVRTPEIEAFEAAWLAWVRAGCKKDNRKESTAA